MQYLFPKDYNPHQIQDMEHFKKQLKEFSHHQLFNIILPYWIENAPDYKYEGFVGEISDENKPLYNAHKGLILNARILWSFSSVHLFKNDNICLDLANRAYNYLMKYFKDNNYQGYYWNLDFTGKPVDTKKQIYSQAFVIYALSEYYKINKDKNVLNEAVNLYQLIEKHAYDKTNGGYFEAYTREWELIDDVRLSEKDMNEQKTMNTHLHVLEAYTNLYRIWPDDNLKIQLSRLIDVFSKYFVNYEDYHLNLFFDENWNLKSNDISFGHDIEASWLLYEAAEAIDDKDLMRKASQLAVNMAKTVLKGNNAIGGLIYEMERGKETGEGMEWWTESEAVVGFYNAYQLTGDKNFLNHAFNKAVFIDRYYSDNENGEWHNRLYDNGEPVKGLPKAGFWKCPYHNTRMCLELIRRIK